MSQKRTGAYVLGGLALLAIVVIVGMSRTPAAPPEPQIVAIGNQGQISVEQAAVAVDERAFDALTKASAARDDRGYAGVLAEGRDFMVPAGTRVQVLDKRSGGASQVRVLDGPNAGRSGWIPYEWVK